MEGRLGIRSDMPGHSYLRSAVAEHSTADYERFYRKCRLLTFLYLRKRAKQWAFFEDIIQEVLTRAWANRESFRGESDFGTYLTSIIRHVLSESFRAQKRLALAMARYCENFRAMLSHALGPEQLCEGDELIEAVRRAIAELPNLQQSAVMLVYFEQKSVSEAAASANCSAEALRSRLRRAEEALGKKLDGLETESWQARA
jgi:RNA polymerase sigma-70 factor, ECF subfamily